jgi:hypothetical protein
METPVSSITSQGDLGGTKVKMTIDENSLAHIMSIMTDLYSDPQLAVIREYSTNALDAHIECGNTDPIEVFTPSNWSPYFKVVDHGVGLSVNDIIDMYSKYGASSKRGTNEQVGMLGLGAKSALTLVPQFNLTSVKDGVKIFVSISRASDGSGQMEIIDTVSTTESNGVEISIPVPRNHNFAAKCRDFFRFWKKGTVLVDGKEPEYIEGRPVGDKFLLNKNLQKDYIVMGNVAYPVKEGLWPDNYSYNQMGIVAFVNIGDVNFTPSREDLQYTPKTKATIKALQKEFSDNLTASINDDIATSPTHIDAWKRAREWRGSFPRRTGTLTYKGLFIPNEITFEDGKEFNIHGNGRYAIWFRNASHSHQNSHIFIVNFADSMKMSPVQREKVAIYCTQNNLGSRYAVVTNKPDFLKDQADKVWIESFHFVDWAVIAPIKVVRQANGSTTMRTDPYDLYEGNYTCRQVRTLDTTKPIVYYSSAELEQPTWLIGSCGDDAQIIKLSKNRWEKFKRDFPTAQHYKDAVTQNQKKLIDKMTYADKVMWHYSNLRFTARSIDVTRVDDPELVTFINVLLGPMAWSDAAGKLRAQMNVRGTPVPDVDVPSNPLTNYPFFARIDSTNEDHTYWYLNACYANNNKKEN